MKSRLSAATLLLISAPALAQETTSYTYDAKGRIVAVSRSGGPSSGAASAYSYDPSNNRTGLTLSNSPNGSGGPNTAGATISLPPTVTVVPLNGFTVIPANNL